MVGIPTDFTQDPIAVAKAAMLQPGAAVDSVLSSLVPPPLPFIPDINHHSAKAGKWVRYTAMVQDIWDTELFVASSPDGKSGLLVEDAAATNHPDAKLGERLPVYLVSLPGQSQWAQPHEYLPIRAPAASHSTSSVSRKRAREPEVNMQQAQPSQQQVSTTAVENIQPQPSSSTKRSCSNAATSVSNPCAIGLNLPFENQRGASAVVAKLYDGATGRDLKINTMVQVVGVLQDPLEINMNENMENGDGFWAEVVARNPRNVKRLHVVTWREMKAWELNPLTREMGIHGLAEAKKEARSLAGGLREMLVRYFASAMNDDILAAEYLVMGLLSRPVRTNGDDVLGKLSVNIVLPKSASTQDVDQLIQALKQVCCTVVEINVSISSLNSVRIFPKKDYVMNRLKAGVLQMAPGTCLVVNECNMKDGVLAERGLENMKALTCISQKCCLPLDFEFYRTEVGIECFSVLISKEAKSLVPADVQVRVQRNGTLGLQKWNSYDADVIRKLRLAVMLLAEDGEFDISREATQDVEKVYVEARRSGRAKDGQDCLQKWLSVARCCARSFGENTLTAERWQCAVDMERRREERIGQELRS